MGNNFGGYPFITQHFALPTQYQDEDANVQKSNGEKTRNMCGTNKEIQLGNISVIERNAYGMQKSARPSPPLSAVSNKTATARTGE